MWKINICNHIMYSILFILLTKYILRDLDTTSFIILQTRISFKMFTINTSAVRLTGQSSASNPIRFYLFFISFFYLYFYFFIAKDLKIPEKVDTSRATKQEKTTKKWQLQTRFYCVCLWEIMKSAPSLTAPTVNMVFIVYNYSLLFYLLMIIYLSSTIIKTSFLSNSK